MTKVSPRYRNSGLDTQTNLLLIGLILLNLSQSCYFLMGWPGRIASLFVGGTCLVYIGVIRFRLCVRKPNLLYFGTIAYFSVLLALSWVRGHDIWNALPMAVLGTLIALALFLSGLSMAAGKQIKSEQPNTKIGLWGLRALLIVAILGLLKFLTYIKSISLFSSTVERGFGADDLNPVSVAFNHGTLFLICIVSLFYVKSKIEVIMMIVVSFLSLAIMLSSGSRGAVIYVVCVIFYLLFLKRARMKEFLFSFKSIVYSLCVVCIFLIGVVYLYNTNYGVALKIDILFARFMSLSDYITSSHVDKSSDGRLGNIDTYFNHPELWLLFGQQGYVGYPHNQFIEIIVRFGVFGLPLLLLSLFIPFSLIKTAFQRGKSFGFEFTLITVLFLFGYLQSMTSLSLEMNRVMWLGYGYITGYIFVMRNSPHRHKG